MTSIKETQSSQNQEDQSPQTNHLIKRSLRYLSAGYPVHLTGPTGVGKTTAALRIAKERKRPIILIHGNKDLSNEDLIGAHSGYNRRKFSDNFVRQVQKIEENVSEQWTNGRLYEAVKNGYTVVYDEFTRSQPETNNLFLSIVEERVLPLYGTKRTESYMDVHPEFSVIFTSNPSEYAGVFTSQDALLDRLITIPVDRMSIDEEIAMVQHKTSMEEKKVRAIVEFVHRVRALGDKEHCLSSRASIMIAEIAERFHMRVKGEDEDFQHLCLDVTFFPLQGCMDDREHLKEKLLEECRKI